MIPRKICYQYEYKKPWIKCEWWCKLLQSTGRPKVHRIFIVCLWRTNCKCIKIKTSKDMFLPGKAEFALGKNSPSCDDFWNSYNLSGAEKSFYVSLLLTVRSGSGYCAILVPLDVFKWCSICEIAANMVWRQYIAHDFSTHFHASSSIVNYSGNLNFKEDRETCISLLLSILEPFFAEVSQNHGSLTLSVRTIEKEVWD